MDSKKEKLTNKELEKLFCKYDQVELIAINTILSYAKKMDTTPAKNTVKKILEKDTNEDLAGYYMHTMSVVNNKTNLLTKKEADYLLDVVNDSRRYLESVELFEPDVYIETEIAELTKIKDSLNSITTNKPKVLKLNLTKK